MKSSVRESVGIVGVQSEFTIQEVIVLANFKDNIQRVLDFKECDLTVELEQYRQFARDTVVLLDKLTQGAKSNEKVRLELFAPILKPTE